MFFSLHDQEFPHVSSIIQILFFISREAIIIMRENQRTCHDSNSRLDRCSFFEFLWVSPSSPQMHSNDCLTTWPPLSQTLIKAAITTAQDALCFPLDLARGGGQAQIEKSFLFLKNLFRKVIYSQTRNQFVRRSPPPRLFDCAYSECSVYIDG